MLEARMMSLPPVIWLESDLLSSDQQNRNTVSDNPRPHQPKFLFPQDLSLALIDQNGNFEDLIGDSGMSSPQLTKENYQKMLDGVIKSAADKI